MSTTVSMPQLGETVTEGTILRWAKKVGDEIAEDEVLVEISTDKVDTEVPSPVGGTILQILVDEGETVGVGVDLVVIGDPSEPAAGADESADITPAAEAEAEADARPEAEPAEPESDEGAVEEPAPSQVSHGEPKFEEPEMAGELHPASETPAGPDTGFEASSVPETAETSAPESGGRQGAHEAELSDEEVEAFFTQPSPEGKPQLLSPVVRRLVRENEVDLGEIEGTGQGGRITRRDVESYLAERPAVSAEPAVEAPPAEPVPAEPQAKEEPAHVSEPAAEVEEEMPAAAAEEGEVELDRVRVRIAENMTKARHTAAHVWTSVEVDFERVERVRQAHKAEFKEEEGFSLTYLPFISRATIDALKAFPVVNSSFDLENKTSVFHKKVDLGIAIDLNQGGLVVARVRNADGLRLVGIAREIKQLADKARDGKLGPDDLTGSTFTITNPGPFGSFMSAPIINIPNVAILSTDTVAKRPTVVTSADGQDMIAIRHIGYLGLSWDHRAFDGSTAVLFLRRIKENLESWDWEQELA